MQRPLDVQRAKPVVRTEWTSRVIPWSVEVRIDELTGVKHSDFEDLLNEAFGELATHGYHVTAVQQYPYGFVVLANRVVSERSNSVPPMPSTNTTTEAIYTWRGKDGVQLSQTFNSIEEALQLVATHLEDRSSVPVVLHQVAVTRYNPMEIERLVQSI